MLTFTHWVSGTNLSALERERARAHHIGEPKIGRVVATNPAEASGGPAQTHMRSVCSFTSFPTPGKAKSLICLPREASATARGMVQGELYGKYGTGVW